MDSMEQTTQVKFYLGKTVAVVVDRPQGTPHPRFGWAYPINYGFVPNTISGDGEELDAYILNVHEPLTRFEGVCCAVIHRVDDDDDKLIVIPHGQTISDEEIRQQTYFQERFFHSEIWRG